jgi:hypothetical protein
LRCATAVMCINISHLCQYQQKKMPPLPEPAKKREGAIRSWQLAFPPSLQTRTGTEHGSCVSADLNSGRVVLASCTPTCTMLSLWKLKRTTATASVHAGSHPAHIENERANSDAIESAGHPADGTSNHHSLHMLSAFDQAQRETNINGKRGKGNNASDITNHGKGIRLLCWIQTHPATIKYIVYGKRDCSGDASKVLISTWGVAYFFTLSLVFLNLNKNDINIVPRIDQGGLLRDC